MNALVILLSLYREINRCPVILLQTGRLLKFKSILKVSVQYLATTWIVMASLFVTYPSRHRVSSMIRPPGQVLKHYFFLKTIVLESYFNWLVQIVLDIFSLRVNQFDYCFLSFSFRCWRGLLSGPQLGRKYIYNKRGRRKTLVAKVVKRFTQEQQQQHTRRKNR